MTEQTITVLEHFKEQMREHEWMVADDQLQQIERFNPIPVKNGYGCCPECNNVKPIYKIKMYEDDDRYWYGCRRCMTGRYIRNHTSLRFSSTPTPIFPDSIFPEPAEPISTCKGCNEAVMSEDYWGMKFTFVGMLGRQARIGIFHTASRDFRNAEFVNVNVHSHCSTLCYGCGQYWATSARNDASWAPIFYLSGSTYCIKCYDQLVDEEDIWSCRRCENEQINDSYYSEIYQGDICRTCWNEPMECHSCGYDVLERDMNSHRCHSRRYIKNYSHKPRPKFFGNDAYHMGFELEIEYKDAGQDHDDDEYYDGDDISEDDREYIGQMAKMASEYLGERAYFKEDGSLRCGFEIVTHPHSLLEYQTNFPWEVLSELSRKRMVSWNTETCGLHIHVGRVGFDPSSKDARENHQIRFLKLIYDNERQVTRLAGRSTSYATFSDKGQVIPKIKFGQQRGRYSAVNVENSATLEVRVFKGSLKKERILAQLEFVHAAVEYTRNLRIVPKDNPFAWARFVAYVSNNSDKYSNLFALINKLFATESAVTGD